MLAATIIITGIPFSGSVYAAETPTPYKYIAVAIATGVKIQGGTWRPLVGSNLANLDYQDFPRPDYPWNDSFEAKLTSDDTPPPEYRDFSRAKLFTYDEFVSLGEVPMNKDSSFLYNNDLLSCEDGGKGLPLSNIEYLSGSSYTATVHIPDKISMLNLKKTDYGPNDGSNRTYEGFVTFIIGVPHDEFDPVTGEWDIESKVDALLNMSKETPAVWNYKDFDNGYSTEYEVYMDASASSSARPGEEYTYDMGVNVGGDVDYRNEKTVSSSKYVLSGDIFPDEITGTVKRNGSFRVDGNVTVTDDNGVSDSAYSYTDVDYQITNSPPMALSKTIDKATTSDKYLYAKREVVIKDQSIDFEGHMMDTLYKIFDGENEIASWKYVKDSKNGTWRVESQNKSDEYISSMNINPTDLTNTIVFNKSGNFRLYHMVGDIRNHSIVSQKTDVRTSALNIRPEAAAPVADFSYILNGKATDYTYPNIPVTLQDKSTDANDDITKWEWTKYNGSKEEGQTGATALFPSEGTYNTTLKVTDFLGMTDSITKPIQVLPPIPKAEITTNDDESLMKKNRRIIISSEDSFAPPSDPIQWDKTKWKIEPLDGQNSLSIKISNLLSDSKKKAVVFRETGRYKVTIDLENNYSAANPSHPRISLKTTSIIIEIKEDIKPEPEFELTGNSPNFHDNPTSTVARVTNTSISPDNDYLDIFPGIGLEDPNNFFGRGQNAFEMEIRKDLNEDGIFSSNEVYGNYSGKSVDIPVFFKEGEGSDYQATLKIRETFGQPTLTEFVTDEDRVTNVLVKKFSINWIPDIVFNIPDWAYPDDTLNFSTQIKDEKPDITSVVWSIQKKNSFGVYQNIDINDASINSLTRNGGNIQFKESGYYILKADITDEKGQTSSFQDEIRIYPLPTAIITDNPAYRFDNSGSPAEFNAKQNRTYELLGNTSHINDPYGSGIHNIDHSKDYFEIIPTSGQPVDTIKVTNGIGGLLNLTSEDSSIFKATDKQLDRELMFKLPGTYTVRYQVTNIHGKKSAFAEKTVIVHEDEKPLAEFDIQEEVLRDPSDGNKAAITMYNIKLSSIDRDNISLERVRYRFDSNNDGNFEEEAWINTDIDKINPFNWNVKVKESHVGKYEFELYAEESYGQATINRYISEADKRSNIMTKVCEIDNQAPTADFSMAKREKVDVALSIDKYPLDQIGTIKSQAESIIKQKLLAENIHANVKIIDSPAKKINVLEYYPIIHKDNKTGTLTIKPMLKELVDKYNLANYIEVSEQPLTGVLQNDYNGYDVVIPGGLYSLQEYQNGTTSSTLQDIKLLNSNAQVLESHLSAGGGVILRRGLGKFYNNMAIKENYRLPGPTVFTRYSKPIKIDTTGIARDYSAGVEYEFRATPTKPLATMDNDWVVKHDSVSFGTIADAPILINCGVNTSASIGVEVGTNGVRLLVVGKSKSGWKYSRALVYIGPVTENDTFRIQAYDDVYSQWIGWGSTTLTPGYQDKSRGWVHLKIFKNDELVAVNNIRNPPYDDAWTKNIADKQLGGDIANSGNKFNGTLHHFVMRTGNYGTVGMDRFVPRLFNDSVYMNKTAPINHANKSQFKAGEITNYPFKLPASIPGSWTNESLVNFNPQPSTDIWYTSGGGTSMKNVALASNGNIVYTAAYLDGTDREYDEKMILNSIFYAARNRMGSPDYLNIVNQNFTDKSSRKFFSSLNIGDFSNLTDPTESLKLSSKFASDNINFSVLGTASNKSQFDSFNKKNNGNGKFIDNTNINIALNEYADYIISEVKSKSSPNSAYVLLNEEMDYKINYEDYENDPQMNFHSWKYDHDASYFENSLGRISKNNQWISNSINKFDKVGKYIVEYKTKDNPVGSDDRFDNYRKSSVMPNGPMTIYVHRKPVAKMKTLITRTPTSITANITSLGYDLDHMSLPDNGIRAWEWSYKEVGSSTWISSGNNKTFTFSGDINKDYFVKHRVQDTDGENSIGVWSDENIILVTAKAMPPIADFEVDPTVYPIRTSMTITDFSYDPNGDKLVEYRWTLKKDGVTRLTRTLTNASGVTAAQVNTVRDAVKSTIDSLGHSVYGKWILELQVRDSSSATWGDPLATSDVISRMIEVVPNNAPPTANINPTNVFVDGRNSTDTDNLSNTLNNYINWNLAVSDPDADNKGFVYRWELEHHEGTSGILKSTSDMSSQDRITTKVYTTQQPFVNKSFESNSLAPGPYNVRLQVTDIPTYGEAKSTSVDKKFYIVPKVTGVPYVILEEGKEEIICGDTVTLRIITDEITTGITAQAEGSTATLSFVSKQGTQYIWETPFVIPEIEDSGNMDITFTLKTDFGSKDIFGTEGKTTRIKTLKETIYVTALKLDDFRVTDLVKHSQYKDLYPLRRPDFTLDYVAGYYCTFQINAKGNPERVFADVSHNTSEVGTVELKKVGDSGTYGVWEGKYFAPFDTPPNTVISFDLEAGKGSTKYNYNEKESWNGETLKVTDSILKDAVIARTN